MSGMSEGDWVDLGFMLGRVFRPATPVNQAELFSGRKDQVRKVVDAINQPGCHAILYGERGVGKTSLANILFSKLHSNGLPLLIPHINGINSDTYTTIWRRVFDEMQFRLEETSCEIPESLSKAVESSTSLFQSEVTPDQVRRVLTECGRTFLLVVVIDEFDSVEDPDARRTIADTVKFLSDRNAPVTIVLIGVADDVDDLIDNHQSVERCVSQVALPRMSRDEIEEVVTSGLKKHGMTIDADALHEVSRISRGLPHYAHLLGLHSGRKSIDRRSMNVAVPDIREALKLAIDDVQASIKSDYVKATTSARIDALYKHVLLAAALAECDELGFFYPKDVRPTLSRILNEEKSIDTFAKHLNAFCDIKRGGVLYKDSNTDRPRYRFDNPLLQPYVLIRGLTDGLLTEDDLKHTRNKTDPQKRLF